MCDYDGFVYGSVECDIYCECEFWGLSGVVRGGGEED